MGFEISAPVSAGAIEKTSSTAGQAGTNKSPDETFRQLIDETAGNLQEADRSILEANTGGRADLHDVMIAMEKADISLQTLVQVRNKAVDAYDQIMNMQV